ncbi:sulfatase-like hydrolase/transferase [Sulfitobacter sp. D35]|uniref:sulfatase-like hydrolase/transferase n=1 Tax=Sulfitobacter sp. D35 TaxID=3083252 RepID=UPI00296F479C|nr:sulfatase-like hydrolase/transferase [Sulfitobacter sp. D35]MDW4497213.1 sulfatase-like hydrolase/transferase [Sulfitobacter sp. D35]
MTRPKNLMFIFSDQHAAHVLGAAGDPHAVTPALDRLAARGVRMTNAYCPSPICVPSRMSMLTACHPSAQECWTNDDVLAGDRPTWLHALGAAGIRPGLVGRMHSVGPDQLRGYAWREVGDHSPNYPGSVWHDMGVLHGANDPNPEGLVACGAGQSAYEVKDRNVTDAALAALDRLSEAEEPFALTVGYMLPHAPYVAAAKWVDHFLNVLPPPAIPPGAEDGGWVAWWRHNRGADAVPDTKTRQARAAYWGLVAALDEMIGALLDRLDTLGVTEDTLVVYASDHGDHVGERGLWWKHTFYDESAKVPMILSHPRSLPRGETCDAVVSLIDLSQTMIDALGGSQLPQAQGRSFWPMLTGAAQDWDDTVFCEYCTDAVPAWTGGRATQGRMVRRGTWKLFLYNGEPPKLFDLATDPQECRDRADDPECAEIRNALLELLLADWDPEEIRQRMEKRRARKDVLAAWAARMQPRSEYIWPMDPEMNRLDRT